MLLMRVRGFTSPNVITCPECGTQLALFNVENCDGIHKCPYCSESFNLHVKVEVSCSKAVKPQRGKTVVAGYGNEYSKTYTSSTATLQQTVDENDVRRRAMEEAIQAMQAAETERVRPGFVEERGFPEERTFGVNITLDPATNQIDWVDLEGNTAAQTPEIRTAPDPVGRIRKSRRTPRNE